MKIVTILGSPKQKGNTAEVLSMFEEKVRGDHEVERINITQHKVGGCLGCFKCQERPNETGCVQKDDAAAIFEKMIQADAIVYASPLHCWSFSSQLKPLIDRHVCLVTGYGTPGFNSLIAGTRTALLLTCAGPIEGNCDAIKMISSGFAGYAKATSAGEFILPGCTTPDAIGDEGDALAGKLAEAIVG